MTINIAALLGVVLLLAMSERLVAQEYPADVSRGKVLYERHCMACHGPSGAGNPGPAYPALHGQDSAYVTRRLEEYRTGTTTYTAPAHFNLMAAVSKSLSDEEIRSLASYVQGLHTRAPGTTKESIAR